MLPEIRKVKNLPCFTPTVWQTFLLRNWGMISLDKFASILKTTPETILKEGNRLGLGKISYNPDWQKKGYITLIRNNWHLLTYTQLQELLEMDEKALEFMLKEDDFLDIKLGSFKPYTEELVYTPLTSAEIEATEKISKLIGENFIESYSKPFDFFNSPKISSENFINSDFDKIVYSYSMLYGDALLSGDEIVSDELLERLSLVGINGIWLQGVLYTLSPYPFVDGLSDGYEKRRENLNKLINKCKKYGIKIYLYMNEPRGLTPDKITAKTKELIGREWGGMWSLCTQRDEVRNYLYTAVKDLVQAVPELGGIITITMSENITNCYSREGNDCPVCSKLKKQYVVPDVNNIFMRAIRDAGVSVRLIANLWSWSKMFGWTKEDVLEGISNLDKDIDVLCVSEVGTVEHNGVEKNITEYSISNPGPSKEVVEYLTFAKKLGHKTMAKVQINTTWEMAILPYTPVFDLIIEHTQSLKALKIGGLMASWTLGGYPTVSFDLMNAVFGKGFDFDTWCKTHFAENAELVRASSKLFSEAYRNYPFDISTLYFGPQHLGATNLIYAEPTGFEASMVTYPYDDIKAWAGDNGLDEYKNCLKLLLEGWESGLDLIASKSGNPAFEEYKRFAEVLYVNLKSSYNQTVFNEKKMLGMVDKSLLEEEMLLTKRLYKLASEDCRVGFEASMHYYFTQNSFLERLVNITALLEKS